MKGIRLLEEKGEAQPWLVYVNSSIFGKRIRKRFKTKAEAQHKVKIYENRVLSKERTPLDPEVHKVVALFADRLTASQMMIGLTEAAERFGLANCTLEELGKEFLTHQKMLLERDSVGLLHVKGIKSCTNKLVAELGDIPIQSIGSDMLDAYVNKRLADRNQGGKKTSPRTVKNEVATLSALFNYAIKHGYLTKNSCLDVKLPDYKAPVGICKPEELVTLLAHADHYSQCWIMFGAFGGLRSFEIHRMSWDDVRLDENQFYICGSKNDGAERWVRLTPPLKAFCEDILNADNPPSGLVMGGMAAQTQCIKMDKFYKETGVRIPRNGLRHSFGSHHLVAYNNPSVTAAEMGHIGPQQTFKAYRKEVLKSQAEDFFAICCEAKPWVMVVWLWGQEAAQNGWKIGSVKFKGGFNSPPVFSASISAWSSASNSASNCASRPFALVSRLPLAP